MKNWYSINLFTEEFWGMRKAIPRLANANNLGAGEIILMSFCEGMETGSAALMYYSEKEPSQLNMKETGAKLV